MARILVVHLRITTFEVTTKLGAGQRLTPVHQHGAVVDHVLDVLGLDAVVDQVAVGTSEGIDEVELSTIGGTEAKGGRGVGDVDGFEIELVGVERALGGVECIIEVVVLFGENHEGVALIIVVLLEHGLLDLSTLGRDGQTKDIVLKDNLLLGTLGAFGKGSVGLKEFHIVKAVEQSDLRTVLHSSLFAEDSVGNGCFGNLLDGCFGIGTGDGVVVATCCLNLLGRGLTDIHVPEQQGTHQKSSNYGVFIHTYF